jgi:hypothetical protein
MQLIPTATDAILIELISWDSPFSLSSRYLLGSSEIFGFWHSGTGTGGGEWWEGGEWGEGGGGRHTLIY